MTDISFASYELPPAIIRWITMLRTTQLKKGTGLFFDSRDGTFCALGILCLANGKPAVDAFGVGNWKYVEELLGKRGAFETYDRNDHDELSFPEIADWAEDYFSTHGPHVERARAAALASSQAQDTKETDPMQTVIPNYVVGGEPTDPTVPPPNPIPTPPAEPEEIYDEDEVEDDEDEDYDDDEDE